MIVILDQNPARFGEHFAHSRQSLGRLHRFNPSLHATKDRPDTSKMKSKIPRLSPAQKAQVLGDTAHSERIQRGIAARKTTRKTTLADLIEDLRAAEVTLRRTEALLRSLTLTAPAPVRRSTTAISV